jgi:hypothetical protein
MRTYAGNITINDIVEESMASYEDVWAAINNGELDLYDPKSIKDYIIKWRSL